MANKWSAVLKTTRVNLQSLISGGTLNYPGFYIITDAVGSTKIIQVWSKANNAISGAATNLTDELFGTYDITSDTFTVEADS